MAFNKNKCDPALGQKVNDHLTAIGVQTPIVVTKVTDRHERITAIEQHFTQIMKIMGLDLNDDSLAETPLRVAKMMVNETLWALDYDSFPKCTTVQNKMEYDEMVVEKSITVHSMCEHHFLPIVGKCHIAYIPNEKVLGLSKMPRIVEYFSKRPQIQERLTEQIAHALSYILETEDVAVVIEASHLCVSSRGVEDTSASTTTSKLMGGFKRNHDLRAEFMSIIHSK
jgi:GTP cyclohydrolase I